MNAGYIHLCPECYALADQKQIAFSIVVKFHWFCIHKYHEIFPHKELDKLPQFRHVRTESFDLTDRQETEVYFNDN